MKIPRLLGKGELEGFSSQRKPFNLKLSSYSVVPLSGMNIIEMPIIAALATVFTLVPSQWVNYCSIKDPKYFKSPHVNAGWECCSFPHSILLCNIYSFSHAK